VSEVNVLAINPMYYGTLTFLGFMTVFRTRDVDH